MPWLSNPLHQRQWPSVRKQEFRTFARDYGFNHSTSSPRHPQGNDLAERTVQTLKTLMQKSSYAGSEFYLALLALRTSPNSSTGVSPAELLMGRRLRSRLSVLPKALVPSIPDISVVREQDCKSTQCQAQYYSRRHGTKRLSILAPGDRLLVWDMNTRNCRIPATIIKQLGPRSYLIQLNN